MIHSQRQMLETDKGLCIRNPLRFRNEYNGKELSVEINSHEHYTHSDIKEFEK